MIFAGEEGLLPVVQTARHAQLLAAVRNGPVTRASGARTLWTAAELMPERWKPAAQDKRQGRRVRGSRELLAALRGEQ